MSNTLSVIDMVTREALRFPFQFMGEATKAEYLEFKASSTAVRTADAVRTH